MCAQFGECSVTGGRCTLRASAPLAFAALSFFWAGRAHAAYDPETDAWILGIGDPSPLGYFCAVLYLLTAFLFHRRVGLDGDGYSKVASYGMLVLSVNKALDLQTGLADWGKQMALRGGWYGVRYIEQLTFIGAGIAFGLWALWFMPKKLGSKWPEHRASALASTVLIVFILVRASSLHQLAFLGGEWSGFRMGTTIEVALLATVIVGVWKSTRSVVRRR